MALLGSKLKRMVWEGKNNRSIKLIQKCCKKPKVEGRHDPKRKTVKSKCEGYLKTSAIQGKPLLQGKLLD